MDHRLAFPTVTGWEQLSAARSTSNSTLRVTRNAAFILGTTAAATAITDGSFYLGGISAASWPINATIACGWRIQAALTDPQIVKLHNLYKATLGQGLALP